MKWKRENSEQALTRIEVVIIVAVIAVLAAMLFPALRKDRERRKRSACVINLKQMGLAFHQWSNGGSPALPMEVSTNEGGTKEYTVTGEVFRLFLGISNELNTPKMLVCPADITRRPVKHFASLVNNTNISYFVGVDAKSIWAQETFPSMFLTGDRNLTNGAPLPPNRIMDLASNSVAGWTAEIHSRQGNVGLADGSVQSFSTSKVREALNNTGVATNRLAMP